MKKFIIFIQALVQLLYSLGVNDTIYDSTFINRSNDN